MGEIVLLLILLGALLVLPVGAMVLALIALVRRHRIGELSARVERLEEKLRQARHLVPLAVAVPPVEVLPAEVQRVSPPAPRGRRAESASIESWRGRRGLGWAAVVLLLFATAFFLKHALEPMDSTIFT